MDEAAVSIWSKKAFSKHVICIIRIVEDKLGKSFSEWSSIKWDAFGISSFQVVSDVFLAFPF